MQNSIHNESWTDALLQGVACAALTYVVFGLYVLKRTDSVTISADRDLLLNAGKLPSYFKAKEALLTPVRNQYGCSSCWAFSISEVLADTLSLRCGGTWREHLAPQYLLSCTSTHFGCKLGASPETIYDLPAVTQVGIPLEKDMPYQNAVTACTDIVPPSALRIRTVPNTAVDLCTDPSVAIPGFRQRIIDENIVNMKKALIQFGPICGTLRITKELYEYKGDCIYVDKPESKTLGFHAIEVIGWSDKHANSQEAGFDEAYWIIRNSYSTAWGGLLYGFAYVAMGFNNAAIESRASVCQVEVPSFLKQDVQKHNIWDSFYTSYGEYAADPNKQNFVDLDRKRFLDDLHKARKAQPSSNPYTAGTQAALLPVVPLPQTT